MRRSAFCDYFEETLPGRLVAANPRVAEVFVASASVRHHPASQSLTETPTPTFEPDAPATPTIPFCEEPPCPTATPTRTHTPSPTPSPVPTNTLFPARTLTPTPFCEVPPCPTATPTNTRTPSPLPTNTIAATATPTPPPTNPPPTATPTPPPTGGGVIKYYYFGVLRVALRTSAGVTYLHGDHLGSTSATSGASNSAQTYFPFGNMRTTTGSVPTDFGFTRQKSDDTTGLMFFVPYFFQTWNSIPRARPFFSKQIYTDFTSSSHSANTSSLR